MVHHICALVGPQASLGNIQALLGAPLPTELPFRLWIIPLDKRRLRLLCDHADPQTYGDFDYLGPNLEHAIGRMAAVGRVLYIETDYHGGIGGQAAALFNGGEPVWRATESTLGIAGPWQNAKSPISQGLAFLGVQAGENFDEFDAVGLGRFRGLDDLGMG